MTNIETISENTFILYLGDSIHPETAETVARCTQAIRETLASSVIDLVPSYCSVLVVYDPAKISRLQMQGKLENIIQNTHRFEASTDSRNITLPVYYGEEVAWDIPDLCQQNQLTRDEIISLHSQQSVRVYAVGFAPGFAYMGQINPSLSLPRKATPRLRIPAGSVAIAEQQTAIYPSDSPGGWHIIGRTPVSMIDWRRENPAYLAVGDDVTFEAITRDEYLAQGGTLDES